MHNKGYVVTIVLLIDSTYVHSYIHLIIPCSYNYIFAKNAEQFQSVLQTVQHTYMIILMYG